MLRPFGREIFINLNLFLAEYYKYLSNLVENKEYEQKE